MDREKEERIVTYISTLNINLAGNEADSLEREVHSTSDQSFRATYDSRNNSSSNFDIATEKDVTSVYREACERSNGGTFFQLFSSQQHEKPREGENSTFQRGKAYFEGLSSDEKDYGRYNNDIETVGKQEFSESSVDYESQSTSFSSFVEVEKLCTSETDSTDHYEKNPFDEMAKIQSRTLATTTTITQETKSTTRSTTAESLETTSRPSADYYGETDWYMDILLRMQALDMKQKNLMVQYDFLGKLANQNRQDITQSKDWGQFEPDMKNIGVY